MIMEAKLISGAIFGAASTAEAKLIGGVWAAGGVVFAAATAAEASTNTLVLVGFVTGIGTAAVGVYSAWRAAKHRADVVDQGLVQKRLDEAMARIDDLRDQIRDLKEEIKSARSQVQIWKDLYEQAKAAGDGRGKPATGGAAT